MRGEARGGITSAVPAGSGAIRVHRILEGRLRNYRVIGYLPAFELFPPLLLPLRIGRRALTHAPPDHAVFVAPHGAPLIVTFHNYVLDRAMASFSSDIQRAHYATDLRFCIRAALRRAEQVTAVSQATAALVRDDLGYRGAIEVIPNGVDIAIFHPPADRAARRGVPLQVLFSGNPTRRKGAQWLAPIAARVGARAEIAVTGGLRGGGGGAEAGLRHLGRVAPAAMPDLYRRFDVLLLPSVREGMSLAALEAMASGLAIVASDIPSMREIVDDGRGGLLCPVGDVAAFAHALERLAGDRALRDAMGAHNRACVESDYTEELMVERYRRLFARVTADV